MARMLRTAALALTLVACSHATQAGSGTTENTITEQEIDASEATNAYDVIQRLRRNFFSDRGKVTLRGTAPSRPNVFVDGVPYGELAALRNISARQVGQIRLYRAWEAQQKFGSGNAGGVIEVTTRLQ
jgi:outer membrane cobalamin receptor